MTPLSAPRVTPRPVGTEPASHAALDERWRNAVRVSAVWARATRPWIRRRCRAGSCWRQAGCRRSTTRLDLAAGRSSTGPSAICPSARAARQTTDGGWEPPAQVRGCPRRCRRWCLAWDADGARAHPRDKQVRAIVRTDAVGQTQTRIPTPAGRDRHSCFVGQAGGRVRAAETLVMDDTQLSAGTGSALSSLLLRWNGAPAPPRSGPRPGFGGR
jgi:hypothetical protein